MAEISIEQTVALVTHDLKNPLSAIFSYADLLLETSKGDGLSESQRDIIERLRSVTGRSIALVKNYQVLAQLTSSEYKPQNAPVDLKKLIAALMDGVVRADLPRQESAPVETILPEIPVEASLDWILMERILGNLLYNAINYTPKDGQITISLHKISKEDSGKNCKFSLSIHNTKAFIAENEMDTIFAPFKRGSSSVGKPGSGIGLFIVKKGCELQGLQISLRSDKEFGTQFTITN